MKSNAMIVLPLAAHGGARLAGTGTLHVVTSPSTRGRDIESSRSLAGSGVVNKLQPRAS